MGSRQEGMRVEGVSGGKWVPSVPEDNRDFVPSLLHFGKTMIHMGDTVLMGKQDKDIFRETRRAARKLIEAQLNLLRDAAPEIFHHCGRIDSLKKLARSAFNMTIAKNIYMDDGEVVDTAFHIAAQKTNPTMAAGLLLPSIQMRFAWCARWYEQTMPRVVWTDSKFPEMLMASKADASVESLVRPPWRAFLIDLPKALLFSESPLVEGRVDELMHVLVHRISDDEGDKWSFLVEGDGGCELWRHGLPTSELLRLNNDTINEDYADSLTPEDRRILVLVGRLIVGTCLTLSDPSNIREAKNTKAKKKNARRFSSSAMPLTRNFVVGKPIQLHCRETLQEWVKQGDRKGVSPNVQTLVRGHWKMQVHGPQHSLRKLVHLEPHWRGIGKDKPTITRDIKV